MLSFRRRLRVGAPAAVALSCGLAGTADAQHTRTLTACTPDALAVCAELRLTAGPSLVELALRTVGATGAPTLPVSLYNLVLGTGTASDPGGGMGALLPPTPEGGAVVSDARAWDVFDAGDALFVSALSNRGVGGCVESPDVGGFGQAVVTCGAGQFAVFRFTPTALFDPDAFTLLNLEFVGLRADLPAASCGGQGQACRLVADTAAVVPEPGTVVLVAAGLLGVAVASRRRA